MWTPQLQPAEFPWDKIKALHPAAYAALFDAGDTIALFTQGDTPLQFSEASSPRAREAGEVDYMRDFRLRDLYEFFDAHDLCIFVHPAQLAGTYEDWNLAILTRDGRPVIGRKQLGCTSRLQVEMFAYINAFALLDDQLTKAQQRGNDVEPRTRPSAN